MEQYNEAVETIKTYNRQAKERFEASKRMARYMPIKPINKDTPLYEADLSIRVINALQSVLGYDLKNVTIRDLEKVDMSEIAKLNNFGKKSLIELEELITRAQ